jgi:UDP-N-acetylglucosamine 2-epimerase (non-hydrolysing)
MKIMTVLGTRPEIIRLSQIIPKLDKLSEHVLVHTGQNYDQKLSEIFFDELGIREPDHYLGIKASDFSEQVGMILEKTGALVKEIKPDRILILGDTNSGLVSVIAARMGIPVYHLEAGNRCFDDRVPEEVNRRIIDHTSTILMPYTSQSKENLLREGIERERIFIIGNPIYEVLLAYQKHIDDSKVLKQLDLKKKAYFLVTMHRSENVDDPARLSKLIKGLSQVAVEYNNPVLVSVHPRTANKLDDHKIKPESDLVRLMPPLGFFDYVHLEKNARLVLTDSGTVQEECAIFGVPNVTIRDVTERPETLACGSNMLSGADPEAIIQAVKTVLDLEGRWNPPLEYTVGNVSDTVTKILLGYLSVRKHRDQQTRN